MSRQVGVKRRVYDQSMVDHAAEVVRSGGMSLCQASKTFKVPKTTLHDRVRKKYEGTQIGPKTVLTFEEETRLEEWALHMSRIGYGRTRKELAHVVKQILDVDGRTTPFVDNRPGRKWMDCFFARHPTLNLRTTVQLGKERAIINKAKILKWFVDLELYVKEEVCDPDLLKDPSRIYNADESGISLCQTKNRKVIGETGAPVIYQYGNSDKTQMTIMAAASAVGHYIAPMIIFPGQRFSYNPLEGFEEAALGRSDTGWMDSDVFTSWLKDVFIPGVEARQVKKPVLLLIDGHKTHITMNASNICVAHGIELYCLLEHSSHLTQPLDLRLFGLLKQSWREAVRTYQSENIGEFVTKQTFARVFKQAWLKSSTVEAAIKGFQDSGIFPWNPQKVMSSVKLVPSTVFTEDSSDSTTPTTLTAVSTPAVAAPVMNESPVLSVETDIPTTDNVAAVQVLTMNNNTIASTAVLVEKTPTIVTAVATPSTTNETTATTAVSTPSSSNVSSDATSPFSKYLVFPKTDTKKSKVRRMIMPKAITGVKYREWLKEKEAKKEEELKEKQQRQAERLKKKLRRAEELKERKDRCDRKRKEREEANRRRKQMKERKKEEADRIMKAIEASDSDDNIHVNASDCFKCETPYNEFIQCTNCARRFHLTCVADELIDGVDELPFECKYC